MNNLQRWVLLAATSYGLSGCATVINGTSQDYQIRSEPAGAKVKLTNGNECVTPCQLNLKRRHDFRADFQLKGYEPLYVLVQSRTGGAAVGNILLGGLIGGVVDGSNGASNHLYPQPMNVKMATEGSSDEPMLLDKNGKQISSVKAHNDAVRADVSKTIGVAAAGMGSETVEAKPVEPSTVSAAGSPENQASQGDAAVSSDAAAATTAPDAPAVGAGS